MSKDPSQSRIPRIGSSSSLSSRIPIPGSIRSPQFQSRLVRPSPAQTAAIFGTPASSLRPPRTAPVTIARSYSGDRLCGETFPVLAASTPACPQFKSPGGLPFYSKLRLGSTEDLDDVKRSDTFAVRPTAGPVVVDYTDGDRMLVDESLELVGAGSTDNLVDPELGVTMLRPALSNETITLNSDGNVTYEVRRSGTFATSSLESLKLGGSRESLNRTREKDSSFLVDKSSEGSPALNKTHILDMDVQDSTRVLNSTMVTNKALNQTHILDTGVQDPTRVLSSTMTTNRLINVTQSIPNITKELEGGAGLPHIRSDSLLYHTHEVNSPDRLLPAESVAQRPTRLTFNLNETTELLHISDPSAALNRTHVFCSTMHSPAESRADALNVTRDIQGTSLIDAMHLSSLPLDSSFGDKTLVAEDFDIPDSKGPEEMEVDDSGAGKEIFDLSLDEPISAGREEIALRPLEGRCPNPAKQRFSFGLDLTECTLDCSIELCDSSISSTKPPVKSPVSNSLTKQGSFEMDESLGILTPDQMKEFLDSTTTNTNNTNNLELQLNAGSHKHGLHQCRIDQTPSPEELPLDPVGVKTDMSDIILPSEIHSNAGPIMYQEISQTDSDSKTDQMTKSATSKVSNSFITSITSITSLDTGYQGDGEMSRPASRGADHSPSNGPRIKNQGPAAMAAAWNVQPAVAPVPRRQDPMTDSDFFTESDADDVFNRGDRRAQIIDGQLYGPMMQGANVFINQQPQNDDSCMESSGIFTDVDNRGDDDLVHRRSENDETVEPEHRIEAVGQQAAEGDMSPDTSTDTISSSNTTCSQKKIILADGQTASANCLHDASMVSSINTNASSPVQLADKLFSSDCETPDSHHRCDVTKHIVTPASNSSAASGSAVATQNQSSSSPSLTTTLVNGRADSSGVGNVSVECATSFASRGVSNTSTDSLSGASVGSGSISSVSNGKKLNSSRKQQKNESNLVLKKHEMKSCSTRLFKDSVVSSSRSVGGSVLNLNVGGECENQENRRPISDNHRVGGGARGGFGGVSGSVGNLSFIKKATTPNKWDAVMNKIAENKAVVKRNFSDVKSKISCGKPTVSLSRRVDSPASLKSPPSECNSIGSGSRSVGAAPKSVGGKRTISGSMKRGRTHSKDSQRSSQSDLSFSSVAAKLQSKASSTRPAKKRDVRTINSSSSDLGPPSKTLGGSQQQQQHGQQPQPQLQRVNLRTPSTLQKRISPNVTNASTSIVPELLKGSPPLKRNFVAKRVLSANNNNNNNNNSSGTPTSAHVVKTPLRDHNRLVGPTPTAKQQQQQSGANSPKSQTKALIRSNQLHITTSTNAGQNNHTSSNNNNNNSSSLKNATNLQRNGTIILEKSAPPLVRGADGLASPTTAAVIVHPKQALDTGDEKLCDRSLLLAANAAPAKTTIATTPNHNLVDISLLNHANRGVEALGVLVQYLVFNLDAFSCPLIKKSHQKTTRDLLDTKSMLDAEHHTCQSLKQQLHETTERETELQELHRCEISKAEANLIEQRRSAADRITALEAELLRKELEADMKLRNRTEEFETKLAERDAQLKQFKAREVDLLQRISDLSCTENELREKVHSSELEFSERLQAATMRERDLTDQLKHLNRQMEEMRRATEARERELQEKICLTQDECSFLRHSRNSSEPPQGSTSPHEQSQRSSLNGDHTLMGGSLNCNRSSSNLSHAQILQDEVDSLRYVLDLKQREVSDLRKITQEYERDAKELPAALVKISALESRIEDLQVQIKTKTEEEKELQHKMKLLQDNLKQETKVKSRLSQHNEELQWKLKQNSEKFSHVYAELSKSYHENSSILSTTRTSLEQTVNAAYHHNNTLNHSRSSCSERVFDMDDLSPPTSPVIKGVVEKSDSVSWVLEMDDEPPEITASRMVRRAGSFRSSFTGANQDMKRHKGNNVHSNSSNGSSGIQQSSSTSSIQKQHDNSSSTKTASPGTPRLRSNSVNVKSTDPPKKIVRSNSGASTSAVSKPIRMAEMPLSWKEPPLYSSSPYAHKRFLNERMENGGNKTFAGQRDSKDFFLEETESISDMGGESPYCRSRAGSFSAGPSDPVSERSVEFFHRDKTPNFKKSKENRGLITCDTKALTGAGNDVPALKKRREFARKSLSGKTSSIPKEAAGEALVSGSNSDDEASSSSSLSDDLSSGRSSSSGSSSSSSTGSASSSSHSSRSGTDGREALVVLEEDGELQSNCSAGDGRRRSSNISLGDALMQKIVASLNGGLSGKGNETPMEVSWSEDGDPSESVV